MGLEEPNITIQCKNNLSQISTGVMQLRFDWSPTAPREQDTNRATSGETRQNQKTAALSSLKGHSRVKQERDQNTEKTANAQTHREAKDRGSALKAKNIVTTSENRTGATKDDHEAQTHNHSRKWQKTRRCGEAAHLEHNQQKKLHIKNTRFLTMRKGPQTDYTVMPTWRQKGFWQSL